MRVPKVFASSLAILLLVVSGSVAAQPTIQELADRWVHAYNRHDVSALTSVYEPDAVLMMHGAPSIVGRIDISEFWARDFEEGNPLTLLTVTHAIDGIDMILVHGNWLERSELFEFD